MTAELLIELGWKSVLTAGVTMLAVVAMKNRSAGERSWVAHLGLLTTALLPLTTALLRPWHVSPSAAIADTFLSPLAFTVEGRRDSDALVHSTSGPPPIEATPQVQVEALFLWLYSIPAVLMLGLVLFGVVRLGILRRRAAVLADRDWLSALARAQIRMNFKHGTALLVSDDVTSPVSWGLFRPVIMLNRAAASKRAQAEPIIAHELAHVTRLDWAKLILGRLVGAIYWFNPLVWMLAQQCHELREEAADDAVLRSEVPKADYAELLVRAARHENKGILLAANGVAPSRGSLARRVSRILDGKLSRAPARPAFCGMTLVGMALLATPLSALSLSGNGASPKISAPSTLLPPPPVPPGLPPSPPPPLPIDPALAAGGVSSSEAQLIQSATELQQGEPLRVGEFTMLELRDGADVVIRPGEVRSVRMMRDGEPAKIALDASGKLYILGCKACAGSRVRVEVTTPRLRNATVAGNGKITFARGFASVPSLDAAVRGSGTLDVRSLNAVNVNAAVKGDGRIFTRARTGLMAAIIGRGTITYWGSPTVTSAVIGGGSITQAGPT